MASVNQQGDRQEARRDERPPERPASGLPTGLLEAALAPFSGPNAAYLLDRYEQFQRDPISVEPAMRAFFQQWPGAARPPGPGEPARPASASTALAGVTAKPVVPTSAVLAARAAVQAPAAALATVPEIPAIQATPATLDAYAAKVAAVGKLATAIREYGHRAARLDPLGTPPPGDPELDPAAHGLSEAELDLLPAVAIGGPAAEGAVTARQAIDELRRIYCGTTAYDFNQVQDIEERRWLRDAAESERFRPPKDPVNELALLERLSEVGAFERYLQRTFPGQTRFSIEGCGMLIPMLDEVIGAAAEAGTRAVLIGMAHRGRLNVLAHVLGKPLVDILEEFKHPSPRPGIARSDVSGEAFTGDVKYHLGARRAVRNGQRVEMAVTLAPNPSHLEYVDPVIEGMARAAGELRSQTGAPAQDERSCLPVLIHGDASFPGQGVVAETLNLSRLPGYRTGGSLHIIVNNQLGFTVEPENGRSTLYASDLAKGFEIPIIHVNADDVEACVAAARLAHCYREQFNKDFLIDLIGYRRWGHNEGDDPSLTQPVKYAKIAEHSTVRELWAAELVRRGKVTEQQVADRLNARIGELQRAMAEVNARLEQAGQTGQTGQTGDQPSGHAGGQAIGQPNGPVNGHSREGAGETTTSTSPEAIETPASEGSVQTRPHVATGVPREQLLALNEALYQLPEGFHLHPRLEKFVWTPRRTAFERATESGNGQNSAQSGRQANGQAGASEPSGGEAGGSEPPNRQASEQPGQPASEAATIDWGHAETLAFASILADGTPIRLTGQDAGRGTYAQRHAVLHDAQTGATYEPICHVPQARASCEIWDSPLSESAVLGFEFGYSVQAPEALVLWEAQYGDFVNSAQVMIDQFLVSARAKWGQQPSLVLLLPHGYEGQGPEHSSGRPERFLEACAEDNMRVANCTTAAQYFHLLRRHAALLQEYPRPLVVFTPKSLLRHKLAASAPADFCEGTGFQMVLDDPFFASQDTAARAAVRRVVLCTGKVYVDLASSLARTEASRAEGAGAEAASTGAAQVALLRVEQLYPFPSPELASALDRYPHAEDVVWLQEEPRNMGAWAFVAPRIEAVLKERELSLRYIGRPERSSPAEGDPTRHAAEQARLVAQAFAGLVPGNATEATAQSRPTTAATRRQASQVPG